MQLTASGGTAASAAAPLQELGPNPACTPLFVRCPPWPQHPASRGPLAPTKASSQRSVECNASLTKSQLRRHAIGGVSQARSTPARARPYRTGPLYSRAKVFGPPLRQCCKQFHDLWRQSGVVFFPGAPGALGGLASVPRPP